MSSSDARELRGDSKKRWRNLDEAKRAELLLLCLEMYAASPANGEKPQSSSFLERLQHLQWSYSLENMMHMENLGSLLGLREACVPVDPVWWSQTQQAEDRPSTWEKSEVPASTKSSSCPCSQGKNFFEHRLSYTVRLLQAPASPSDEQEREAAAAAATIFSSLFCY